MAKFVNNSKISQLARRASAEGVEISTIAEAIKAVSKKYAEDAGYYTIKGESKTHKELGEEISNLVEYRGGYLYLGDFVTVNGGLWHNNPFFYRSHCIRDYDKRDPEDFYGHNVTMLEDMEEGTIIKIGHERDTTSWDKYILEDGTWKHINGFDGVQDQWVNNSVTHCGFVLFEGIRADVARACGYELNEGFHWAFDRAVESFH